MREVRAVTTLTGDADAFLAGAWATSMHLHRADAAEVGALLSLEDVDRLVTESAIRTPSIRLARDGDVLAESCFTTRASLAGKQLTGLVDVAALLAEFDDGATVVLQGLHRSWPPLTRLVAALEQELGHPGQANAYLTPPDSRGFALHADSHDVFVVQTHGVKNWEVHDADEVHDVLMAPGSCLYLPRGTRHAARTLDASPSLHVTIGIRPTNWRAVVRRAVTDVLDELADELDSPLPPGWVHDPTSLSVTLQRQLEDVASRVGAVEANEILQDRADRFLVSRPSTLGGGLLDRLALEELDDTTLVRRRPGHVMVLRDDDSTVRVLLGDREVAVPGWVRPALEHLAAVEQCRPADLAEWLDRDSRGVLVRRMVREGLLQVVT